MHYSKCELLSSTTAVATDVPQWDLGEFRQKGTVATRWGTKEELLSCIKTAHENGIGILIDAVLNVGYAPERTSATDSRFFKSISLAQTARNGSRLLNAILTTERSMSGLQRRLKVGLRLTSKNEVIRLVGRWIQANEIPITTTSLV